MQKNPIQKVLFVRLHGLGDTLMTTPAIHAVRKAWPDCRLDMVVGKHAAAAVKHFCSIDRLWELDEKIFYERKIYSLLKKAAFLRREKYDLVILFSRSPGMYLWCNLFGAGKVISFRRSGGLKGPELEMEPESACYEVKKNLGLLACLGIDIHTDKKSLAMELSIDADSYSKAKDLLGIAAGKPYLVLAPGGGRNAAWNMEAKQWPVEKFYNLAKKVHSELAMQVVTIGSEDDRVLTDHIKRATDGQLLDLCGQTSIAETAAIIEGAELLVCNDSLAMHLALIVKTRTAVFFGPTNPRAVLPEHHSGIVVLQAQMDCCPCFWQDKKDLQPGSGFSANFSCRLGTTPCREAVSVEAVFAACKALLEKKNEK